MNTKSFLKIVILGDCGVGKTNLLHTYFQKQYTSDYRATIGADFFSKTIQADHQEYQLHVWDTAGQERFQSLGNAFFRSANCCVVMYDMTKLSSFDNVRYWIDSFYDVGEVENGFPIVVLGNKSDLHHLRHIDSQKARRWCDEYGYYYFEISAKTNNNVSIAFEKIIEVATYQCQHKPESNSLQLRSSTNPRCCF